MKAILAEKNQSRRRRREMFETKLQIVLIDHFYNNDKIKIYGKFLFTVFLAFDSAINYNNYWIDFDEIDELVFNSSFITDADAGEERRERKFYYRYEPTCIPEIWLIPACTFIDSLKFVWPDNPEKRTQLKKVNALKKLVIGLFSSLNYIMDLIFFVIKCKILLLNLIKRL